MIRLVDAHNHLQDERFGGRQVEIIAAARTVGITRMVVNGSTCSDWADVAALARQFPDLIIPSFGVHPWYVHEQPTDWEESLRDYLEDFPQAGVGEVGLDRWKSDLPWEGQVDAFRRQLRLARELKRPVSIHCLRAWGALVDVLESEPLPERGLLMHSYGGSAEMVSILIPYGARFSLPGYFLRPDKENKLATFRRVPSDRLLIETDAPDQLPPADLVEYPIVGPDGQPINHPANLRAIYRRAAEALDRPFEEFVSQVEANFAEWFGA
ncbi:MAG: TatD family hydrolase [Kiritimatiellae bacterium]|nr:TatD family hydrolase [Kiritimatiellia bacterium]MDW8457959.1 TatD family hydrolase [Verrucomicrobiota bacterium]